MEINSDFIHDTMTINEQLEVWRAEYMKLFRRTQNERIEWEKREEKGLKLIKHYQKENDKMAKTNKLGMKLVENLRKQIEKYQNNDTFINNNNNENADNSNKIDNWKSRFLTEKRTSEYLRAECEDLQNEIEELKENNNENNNENINNINNNTGNNNNNNNTNNNANNNNNNGEAMLQIQIVNEAWEEEVTKYVKETRNYKVLYEESQIKIMELKNSKYKLINATSREIDELRHKIKINADSNKSLYKKLFDRIVRYHNLDGTEDTLFQLMTDAQLKK